MRTFFRSLLTALGVVLCLSAFADVRYRVIDLGTYSGADLYFTSNIDNHTQIVGLTASASFTTTAFLWQPATGFAVLEPPAGAADSSAAGIDPGGRVVGYSTFNAGLFTQACIWDVAHNVHLLGPTPTYQSYASDINTDGEIVGQFDYQPAFWERDGSLFLLPVSAGNPYGGATRINKHGEIAGFTYDPTTFEQLALFWDRDHNPTVIGTMDSAPSSAYDINDHGWVVGGTAVGAFVWHRKKGIMALPGLAGPSPATFAGAINNHMQIVGASLPPNGSVTDAVLWENGQITDLNTLIDPNSGWLLSIANGINDRGEICGSGTNYSSGQFLYHAFLLKPIHHDSD